MNLRRYHALKSHYRSTGEDVRDTVMTPQRERTLSKSITMKTLKEDAHLRERRTSKRPTAGIPLLTPPCLAPVAPPIPIGREFPVRPPIATRLPKRSEHAHTATRRIRLRFFETGFSIVDFSIDPWSTQRARSLVVGIGHGKRSPFVISFFLFFFYFILSGS